MLGRIAGSSLNKGIVTLHELVDIFAERFDIILQADRGGFPFRGADPVQSKLIYFLHSEVIGKSAPGNSIDDKFRVCGRSGNLTDAEIVNGTGSFAGAVVRDGENMVSAANSARSA